MAYYWGDDPRFFLGRVVSNSDLSQMGRYQIRIFGIHDNEVDIPNEDLPWAQVVIPTTEQGIGGVGANPQISQNAMVYGMFLDGKLSQIPLIIGTITTIQAPSSIQTTDPALTANGSVNRYGGVAGSFVRESASTQQSEADFLGPQEVMPDGETIISDAKNMAGSNTEEKIYNALLSGGLSASAVCGLMGNFAYESGPGASSKTTWPPNPTGKNFIRGGPWNLAINPSDRGMPAFGLAQWRNDRWQSENHPGKGIVPWAESNGLSWRALSTQCRWVIYELSVGESGAGAKLREATNPADAAYIVCRYYERPQNGKYNWRGKAPSPLMRSTNTSYCTALGGTKPYKKSRSLEERIKAANGYWNRYVVGTSSSTGVG